MRDGRDEDFDVVPLADEVRDADMPRETAGEPAEHEVARPQPAIDPGLIAFQPEVALRPMSLPPSSGWRRALWELSGRQISLVSNRERRLAERLAIARRPLFGPWAIAVMSMKGGVGKTTTCAGVGHVFASERGDLVVAVDFNPDGGGALVRRVGQETNRTISDLLASRSRWEQYADIRAFTSQARSGLQVLAANRDPEAAAALDAGLYRRTRAILGIHYSVILLDCGTGLLADAAQAAVEVADQIVVVASASLDAADVSYRTIEWLEKQGYPDKARDSVVVINTLESDRRVRVDVIESAFRAHCRAVVRVPRDPHLRLGTLVELDALQRETREAYVELAATLAEGFRL
jgi:MinD-like ATPase involved in chromosome partitioning or flagellar assembly